AGAGIGQAHARGLVDQGAPGSLLPLLAAGAVAGSHHDGRSAAGGPIAGGQAQAIDLDGPVGVDGPVLLVVVRAGDQLNRAAGPRAVARVLPARGRPARLRAAARVDAGPPAAEHA